MKIKISAGLALVYDNKVLLGHPTNAAWYRTYSFPKGVRKNRWETLIDTAIRETKEEVGISIDKSIVTTDPIIIEYRNNHDNLYKECYIFVVDMTFLKPMQITPEFPRIPDSWLQKEEIDWAGFVLESVAREKIFWRFDPVLDLIFGRESNEIDGQL